MGKKFSCVKKSRSRDNVTNEDDDNNQPGGHDQAVHNPNAPANQADSLNEEETTEEEIAAGLSHASTVLVQDSSPRPSVIVISGPSQPVEPNPVLPMIILTTADNEQIVLEPGGVARPAETSGQHAERPQTARHTLRRMLHLRRTGRLSESSSSPASQKAKKWYKQMKGQIGWTLRKASSRSPKAKKQQYQADDAQPGPSGIRRQQYQADDAQAGPSGIKKKPHQADDAQPGPSGIRKRESKKKKAKQAERRLRETERSFEDNLNARLQYLRGGIISDPALSMSYNRASRRTSRERQTEERRSWTSGMSGDEADRPQVLLLRRSPSRNIPLIPHVPSPSTSPDPVPSRSALTLNLPSPTIPSPPRSIGSPAPQRRSISQLDTRASSAVSRSQSANTLQVPRLRLPGFNLPGPEMSEVSQEKPTTSAVPQRQLPMPDLVPLSAFARVPQRKRRFELSYIHPKKTSPSLPGTPEEEEQSFSEVPQKKPHFALSDVLSQKPPLSQEEHTSALPKVPQEDSNTEQLLATSEVSQEVPTPTMSQTPPEDQPLVLSEVSGEMVPLLEVVQEAATLPQGGSSERHQVLQEKSSSVPQEEPSVASLDVSVVEQSLAVPEVSGEEQLVALPEIAQKESTSVTFGKLQGEMPLVITDVTHKEQSPALPDMCQKEQPLALPEVIQEEPFFTIPVIHIEGPSRPVSETRHLEEPSPAVPEIRREEPLSVPQQEPLPIIPEVEVAPRWIAVPESSHIDNSDYDSSD